MLQPSHALGAARLPTQSIYSLSSVKTKQNKGHKIVQKINISEVCSSKDRRYIHTLPCISINHITKRGRKAHYQSTWEKRTNNN